MSDQNKNNNGNKQTGHIKNILVFCGSRMGNDPAIVDQAETLGRLLGQNGYGLIYGGGVHGLMGVVSRAALGAGSWVKGIIPKVFAAGASSQGSLVGSEEDIVETMMIRKDQMILQSDAAIALPGGDGTIDEIADILVAQEVKSVGAPDQPVQPIIVINYDGFYDDYIRQREKFVSKGFLSAAHQKLLIFVKDAQEAVDTLNRLNGQGPVAARNYVPAPKL